MFLSSKLQLFSLHVGWNARYNMHSEFNRLLPNSSTNKIYSPYRSLYHSRNSSVSLKKGNFPVRHSSVSMKPCKLQLALQTFNLSQSLECILQQKQYRQSKSNPAKWPNKPAMQYGYAKPTYLWRHFKAAIIPLLEGPREGKGHFEMTALFWNLTMKHTSKVTKSLLKKWQQSAEGCFVASGEHVDNLNFET